MKDKIKGIDSCFRRNDIERAGMTKKYQKNKLEEVRKVFGEKKKEDKKRGSDFGLGLGGIFEGLGSLIESVSKIAKEGKGTISKTGEIKGLGDKAKGIYGFTVRTLADGESKVESFGNIKKTPKGPVVEEEREPIVDVFDEKDHILVIAELPGVEEEDIKTEIKGDILNISVQEKERKYKKEVLLPSKVEAEPTSSIYKNGILELKLKKQAT